MLWLCAALREDVHPGRSLRTPCPSSLPPGIVLRRGLEGARHHSSGTLFSSTQRFGLRPSTCLRAIRNQALSRPSFTPACSAPAPEQQAPIPRGLPC